MTRRALPVLVLLAVVAAPFLPGAPPAIACSCAAPAPGVPQPPQPRVIFSGTAVERLGDPDALNQPWRFTVEATERGPLEPGTEIVVHVDIREQRRGEYFMASSCGVADEPAEGTRYRVGGGWNPDSERVYVGLCSSGFLEPVGGPAPQAEPAPPPERVEEAPIDPKPPLTVFVTTTTAPATDATLVAVLDGDGGGGIGGRVAGVGVAGTGAAAGLLLLRRRISRSSAP